jgi:membrane associated rhomboid family serine protease
MSEPTLPPPPPPGETAASGPSAAAPDAAAVHAAAAAEFQARLLAVTPRAWLVPALVGANVAVFMVTAVRGVGLFSPEASELVAWGANYGPATLSGEPWRLFTSTFLHFGALHLAMNMVALWDAGRLMERLLGRPRFAATYLAAGILGSAASLVVHAGAVSAGASGAVFGVYGGLGGFLVRERRAIPGPVLARLRAVAFSFVGYNLLFGVAASGIDMGAHVGGLLAGFGAALLLARPLTPGRSQGWAGAAAVVALSLSVIGLVGALPSPAERIPLTRRDLPGFTVELPAVEVLDEVPGDQAGRLMMRTSDAPRVALGVSWQVQDGARADLEAMAQATASALRITGPARRLAIPGPRGAEVDTIELGRGKAVLWISTFTCGERRLVIAAAGSLGVESLHRRIVPSVRCKESR